MGGYMNRGPSNYFLILCYVIIVLLIVIDDTISSTQIFFILKISFVCIYQIIVICSLLSVLFLIYSYVELLGFLFCLLCMILYLSCSC